MSVFKPAPPKTQTETNTKAHSASPPRDRDREQRGNHSPPCSKELPGHHSRVSHPLPMPCSALFHRLREEQKDGPPSASVVAAQHKPGVSDGGEQTESILPLPSRAFQGGPLRVTWRGATRLLTPHASANCPQVSQIGMGNSPRGKQTTRVFSEP